MTSVNVACGMSNGSLLNESSMNSLETVKELRTISQATDVTNFYLRMLTGFCAIVVACFLFQTIFSAEVLNFLTSTTGWMALIMVLEAVGLLYQQVEIRFLRQRLEMPRDFFPAPISPIVEDSVGDTTPTCPTSPTVQSFLAPTRFANNMEFVMQQYAAFSPQQWIERRSRGGWTTYDWAGPQVGPVGSLAICGVIRGTIAALLRRLYALDESQPRWRSDLKQQHLVESLGRNHYGAAADAAQVRLEIQKLPLISDREWVLLQCYKAFRARVPLIAGGGSIVVPETDGVVIAQRSIDHPKCPEAVGLVRGSVHHAAWFLHELPGQKISSKEAPRDIQMTFITLSDPKGYLGMIPRWMLINRAHEFLIDFLTGLQESVEARV
eukprot:NODE_1833_length_1385_cov_29.488024_g1658_i0.p1 GENE.NODE_1833_length_1385_cov_29.488024_g1658_i0~~NODE_1833_length_1385_cov_29.488024_g1658_i0.p1  ORF type:complete len:381 (-),score=55.16 NODE_1833_length_1385_cov_29.488024_g1658_i0:167-1309(-)